MKKNYEVLLWCKLRMITIFYIAYTANMLLDDSRNGLVNEKQKSHGFYHVDDINTQCACLWGTQRKKNLLLEVL